MGLKSEERKKAERVNRWKRRGMKTREGRRGEREGGGGKGKVRRKRRENKKEKRQGEELQISKKKD